MTSKGDSLKTNEFLRLRKLRLQQVREQSKDIAKKIRQRAKVEQLRHVTEVDKNKEKEYLQRQDKLVNRLEQLYSRSLQNVGAGHKNACDVNEKEIPEKVDLSKVRGKEAAATLKKRKQEKLDEKKKLLDRKLQAREVANVLSREKFVAVTNSLIKSSSSEKVSNCIEKVSDNIENPIEKSDQIIKNKNDMGTQWEFDEIPNEWEPNIPTLSIPVDDSLKNSADDNMERSDQNPKTRRLNLFALSDEMPSSLRGGGTSIPDVRIPIKPSLTLVSEYLQTRGLRLREPDTTRLQKKNTDDFQNIKQTLLRTRASRTDGSVFPNICHVLDEQVIPVPCWRAEKNCGFCSRANEHISKHINVSNDNNAFSNSSKIRAGFQHISSGCEKPKPCPKYHKCHQAHRIPVSGRSNNVEHIHNSDEINRNLMKKKSVTMYDHNTRDTRDLPHNIDKLVVRDQTIDDDAYSQALKEASVVENSINPHNTVQQEVRNRLAITRQNVDKEYRDTLAFLNSLPKDKPTRSIKTAYMDGYREQEIKDKRQHKLQQEYKKIEKQSSKHPCKHVRQKLAAQEQSRSKTKSPGSTDKDNNIVNRDFQYSWLPIPESDGSMAIHTIPNTVKDNKSGNTVKFSSVDTYHEYRSRHKHTPPTKDVDNEQNKRVVEAVIIQENDNNSIDSSSETDTSSVENLQVREESKANHKMKKDKQLDDAERIIIYKVLESKKVKKHKIKKKAQNMNNNNKYKDTSDNNTETRHQNAQEATNIDVTDNFKTNAVSFTQLKEGIYKSVSSKGLSYNVMSCCTNVDFWQSERNRKPWWDNIASLYYSDDHHEGSCNPNTKNTLVEEADDNGVGTSSRTENDELHRIPKPCDNCKNTDSQKYSEKRPSAATSTSSFKTAANEKPNNIILDGGYIKFLEEGEKEGGKFYVGASGFLKDDAYEVIIQLRKKEAEKNSKSVSRDQYNLDKSVKNIEKDDTGRQSIAVQSTCNVDNSLKNDNETQKHNSPTRVKPISVSTTDIDGMHEQIRDDKVVTLKDINEVNSKSEKSIEPPEISNKGISTTFQDIYAIPDNVPKSDPISRPVTSICTQTTHNSPIPKPVFMHLSSSTSTTYMSPPELILPRYLRQATSESCDDTYEPISSNFNSQNKRFTSCKTCKCGKCKKREKDKIHAPPNSTRSTDQTADNFTNEEQYINGGGTESKHKNVKHHKCKNRSESKNCSKHKFKRIPSENKRFHSGSNHSTLSISKSRITNKFDKVNLNPLIENYVKKLLALNKEGLKAIEIVNQECSAVNTPGSSIIDVPSNINKQRTIVCNKISLEQIKSSLENQILNKVRNRKILSKCTVKSTGSQTERNVKLSYNKSNKKRPVHKVKSFNISRQLIKTAKESRRQSAQSTIITTSPCSVDSKKEKFNRACPNVKKFKPHNSPISRQMNTNPDISNNSNTSETSRDSKKTYRSGDIIKTSKAVTKVCTGSKHLQSKEEIQCRSEPYPFVSHKSTRKFNSSETDASNDIRNNRNLSTPPISISTQTNQIDSEVEFMKLAENKLQNMEKIADLTEKCTKRLSNLAKVLEEVRRNKSLAYSQMSSTDCTTDSDQRSDKNMQTSDNRVKPFNPTVEIQNLTEALTSMPTTPEAQKDRDVNNITGYVPILMDLPKPDTYKTPSPPLLSTEDNKAEVHTTMEHQFIKNRGRPPPALTRINLKNVPDGVVIPHELSTVVEVDSPMSIKHKSHTTQMDNKDEMTDTESVDYISKIDERLPLDPHKKFIEPSSKFKISKKKHETQSTGASDDSKIKMMDLQYFNEIMLKPFISLKDFAKQYNLDELDGQTSRNEVTKDENVNEELSSLHSEASLPDVMAELLKRNLISEPFKFETTSNVNSTTVSSESTLSLLALSKARKDKKKSTMLVKNKENIAETSISLSISSNPDLEHAFQRLGMGWASSTLKKTKERLALSSSSNTSSSSIPQFKIKSFNYQDVPELSSLLNISNKEEAFKSQLENLSDIPKNALQQTSLTNSMTVKEFLTNELANKITFSNKTNRNSTDDEFISLCETKMPEEMKHSTQKPEVNEKSVNSPSGSNNRARTSTPVQIFKSMTYHSTSSSNTSNGLFSNADDLSSVKGTSNSIKNHSTSDKDDLTIPNYSLKMRKDVTECSKSD